MPFGRFNQLILLSILQHAGGGLCESRQKEKSRSPNIILDVFLDDPNGAEWSESKLEKFGAMTGLFINPIVYSDKEEKKSGAAP